jgi:hypothetical protein
MGSFHGVLSFAIQFGLGDHPSKANGFAPFLLILGFAVGGGLLLAVMQFTVPRLRRLIRVRLHRRRRLHAAATSEMRSRMQMDELCPHGWQAQIIVYSRAEDLPPDAPDPERIRVALDWAQLELGVSPETIVVRRVWAESVTQALEAMVADRTTDETLARIELHALADGVEWPDD